MNLTSSVIVATALGLRPDGVPAADAGACAFCGLAIAQHDPSVGFKAGSGFMDDLSLAHRGSGMTCGYCAVLMGAKALIATSHGMFSLEEGVKPFRKWADIGRALANPPTGPFCAGYATANNQHMAWRLPVNFSRDLFYVRVGLRDLRIRRPHLLRAVEACERIGTFMGIPPTAKSLSHPFAMLSNNLKDEAESHARLRVRKGNGPAIHEAAAALPDEFALIQSLTLGETWGLRFLLSPGAGAAQPVNH